MTCPFCTHCKHQEELKAAQAARLLQEKSKHIAMASVAAAVPTLDVPTLNDPKTAIAYDICFNDHPEKLHFIEGISGTGKTHLLSAIYAHFINKGKKVGVISQGPFPTKNVAKSMLKFLDMPDDILQDMDVILLDNANQITETSMMRLNEKLKSVMENDIIYGGKVLVVAADFGQILPFTNESQKVRECLKHYISSNVLPFKKYSIPTAADVWSLFLESARRSSTVSIPTRNSVSSLEELIEFTYGNIQTDAPFNGGIILAPRKIDVDVINRRVLEKMKGTVQIIHSNMNGQANRSKLCPLQLRLKKNCIISLEEAVDGLPKGTRLVFEKLSQMKNHLCCRVIEGGQQVDIERVLRFHNATPRSPTGRNSTNFKENRKMMHQFPVVLDFGHTIHGSQGRRFQKVGLFKAHQTFEHGMLYTALSRAENADGLKVSMEVPVIPNKLEMNLL